MQCEKIKEVNQKLQNILQQIDGNTARPFNLKQLLDAGMLIKQCEKDNNLKGFSDGITPRTLSFHQKLVISSLSKIWSQTYQKTPTKFDKDTVELAIIALESYLPECSDKEMALEDAPEVIVADQLPAEIQLNSTYLFLPKQKKLFFYKAGKKKKISLDKVPGIRNFLLLSQDYIKENLTKELGKVMLNYHLNNLAYQIEKEFLSYQTLGQKLKRYCGIVIGVVTAVCYAIIQNFASIAGLLFPGGIVWSSLRRIIPMFLFFTAIVIPSLWSNFNYYFSYVPNYLNTIYQRFKTLTLKKKLLFGIFAVLAGITGLASGGLTYSSTLYLAFLIGITASSSAFPPAGLAIIAIALCLFVAIANFASLTSRAMDILEKENSWHAFKRPIQEVDEKLNDYEKLHGKSRSRRYTAKLIIWACGIFALIGLILGNISSNASIKQFCINTFNAAPQVAIGLGIGFGLIIATLSRMHMTIASGILAAANICTGVIKKKSKSKVFWYKDPTHDFSNNYFYLKKNHSTGKYELTFKQAGEVILLVSNGEKNKRPELWSLQAALDMLNKNDNKAVFEEKIKEYYMGQIKLSIKSHPNEVYLSAKSIMMAIGDACMGFIFFGQSQMAKGAPPAQYLATGFASSWRYLSLNLAHAGKEVSAANGNGKALLDQAREILPKKEDQLVCIKCEAPPAGLLRIKLFSSEIIQAAQPKETPGVAQPEETPSPVSSISEVSSLRAV